MNPYLNSTSKQRSSLKMERKGWNGDSILHGAGVWAFEDDPSKINLFFVNHMRRGSCITIFEHRIGTSYMEFLRNVCHPKILTPNGVSPSAPLSFYYTNDHKYVRNPFRYIEDNYGFSSCFDHPKQRPNAHRPI